MNLRVMLITGAGLVLVSGALWADVLTLRDGRRVQGTLVSVRDGVIEFDAERGGFLSGRERVRLDRDEVAQIDLERDRDRFDSGSRTRDDRSGGGRPSGLRERELRVDARTAWTDTGIVVRPGQTLYFQARGRVRWGPGRQDGPDGERNSPRNDGRPMPSRPAAALIGRVGDADAAFLIGEESEGLRMRSGGTLYLGINDDYLADNAGAFEVTVSY